MVFTASLTTEPRDIVNRDLQYLVINMVVIDELRHLIAFENYLATRVPIELI